LLIFKNNLALIKLSRKFPSFSKVSETFFAVAFLKATMANRNRTRNRIFKSERSKKGIGQIIFINSVFNKIHYQLYDSSTVAKVDKTNKFATINCEFPLLKAANFIKMINVDKHNYNIKQDDKHDEGNRIIFGRLFIQVLKLIVGEINALYSKPLSCYLMNEGDDAQDLQKASCWTTEQKAYQSAFSCLNVLEGDIKYQIQYHSLAKQRFGFERFRDRNINFYQVCLHYLAVLYVRDEVNPIPFVVANYLRQVRKLILMTCHLMTDSEVTLVWKQFHHLLTLLDKETSGRSHNYKDLFKIPEVVENELLKNNLIKELVQIIASYFDDENDQYVAERLQSSKFFSPFSPLTEVFDYRYWTKYCRQKMAKVVEERRRELE
jgi:hypothetical protein